MTWFEDNNIKMNSDKSDLLVSGNQSEQVWTQIGENEIWGTRTVKLLGITKHNN